MFPIYFIYCIIIINVAKYKNSFTIYVDDVDRKNIYLLCISFRDAMNARNLGQIFRIRHSYNDQKCACSLTKLKPFM